MSKRAYFLVLATLALALVASGCGDSDSSASNGEITVETGDLSKAEFISQADAICTKARAKFDQAYSDLANNASGGGSTKELESLISGVVDSVLLPTFDKMVEEIAELGAPDGDEAEVAAFLNTLDSRLDEVREDPLEVGRSLTPFKKAEVLASNYGLDGCVDSFS